MDNGSMVLTTDGAPGTQDNRVGQASAWSFFVHDEIRTGNWILAPGLRYEHIDLTRIDYVRQPDGRSLGPTRVVESTVTQLIPGFGATWLAGEDFNLFASVHRGFNPPGPGSGADPEESLNLEAGLRWHPGAIQAELVGFWNAYDNLVGTCTASTGAGCQIGDQFDGGKARVRGIEASLAHDFGRANGWALKVPARIGYTWTDAEFRSSFSSGFEEWGTVEAGDRLPYLPEHALNLQLGVEGRTVAREPCRQLHRRHAHRCRRHRAAHRVGIRGRPGRGLAAHPERGAVRQGREPDRRDLDRLAPSCRRPAGPAADDDARSQGRLLTRCRARCDRAPAKAARAGRRLPARCVFRPWPQCA
jgi:hypothetical protein